MKEEWQSKIYMATTDEALGRPTDCTPEVIEKIYHNLKKSISIDAAARMSGIAVRTFHVWMARGRQNEEPFVHFMRAVEKAQDEVEAEWMKGWEAAREDKVYVLDGKEMVRKGDWKASESFLRKRKSKDYSDQTFINIECDESMNPIDKITYFSNAIVDHIMNGKVSAESGATILKAIDDRRKLLETIEHEQRIKATEEALKQRGA